MYWSLSECDIVLLLLRCGYTSLRSWRVVIILPSVRDGELVGLRCDEQTLFYPSVRSTARAIDHSPGSVMWKGQTDCSASRSTPEARLTLFVYMQLRSIGLSTEGDSKENLLLIYLPSRTLSCSVSPRDSWYLTDKIPSLHCIETAIQHIRYHILTGRVAEDFQLHQSFKADRSSVGAPIRLFTVNVSD